MFTSRATAVQYEGRANVILHEMAHMWFGDLVDGRRVRPRGRVRRDEAGADVLPRPLRRRVPVGQVRPGVRARVQPRRHGEPGPRDLHRGLRVHLAGHRGPVRGPGQRDPARDGAHVVRRPR
ncbi:hypothetical protein D9C01_12945, partial [Corynebacterium diphtheriae]